MRGTGGKQRSIRKCLLTKILCLGILAAMSGCGKADQQSIDQTVSEGIVTDRDIAVIKAGNDWIEEEKTASEEGTEAEKQTDKETEADGITEAIEQTESAADGTDQRKNAADGTGQAENTADSAGQAESAADGTGQAENAADISVASLQAAGQTDQLILVAATDTTASVTMYEKGADGIWQEILRTSGYVGSHGVGKASESDTKTPAGCFSLSHAFGVEENPGTIVSYTQVNESHYWVDDVNSSYYNRFVSTEEIDTPDWSSAEHLIESPTAYAYAVAIDYNTECIPGEGSAFFLHCSMGKATAGCVTVPKEDMEYILIHLKEDCLIIIDEEANMEHY